MIENEKNTLSVLLSCKKQALARIKFSDRRIMEKSLQAMKKDTGFSIETCVDIEFTNMSCEIIGFTPPPKDILDKEDFLQAVPYRGNPDVAEIPLAMDRPMIGNRLRPFGDPIPILRQGEM